MFDLGKAFFEISIPTCYLALNFYFLEIILFNIKRRVDDVLTVFLNYVIEILLSVVRNYTLLKILENCEKHDLNKNYRLYAFNVGHPNTILIIKL